MAHIVTQESLQALLNNPNNQFVVQVIGKALVVLFNRQTQSEKSSNAAYANNSVGFSHCDARSGTLTAKYFLKHHTLQAWQVQQWTKIQKNGYARLAKYHKQLDEAAQEKQSTSIKSKQAQAF